MHVDGYLRPYRPHLLVAIEGYDEEPREFAVNAAGCAMHSLSFRKTPVSLSSRSFFRNAHWRPDSCCQSIHRILINAKSSRGRCRVENWDEETFGPRKEGGTSLAM